MKILLIGASGQLGGDLVRHNSVHEIHAPARSELDLKQSDQIEAAMRKMAPDVVINCAAFHNLAHCEERPDEAFRVNCIAVRALAERCAAAGVRLVTFSSDYVFGGEKREPYLEEDRPAPLQMYGLSRLAGEYAAMAASDAVVIRTCGLYGQAGSRSRGGNFVDGRVADARAGKRIEMACEHVVAPTSTADLSQAVLRLISHSALAPGIYHLVNEGSCSWYELTKAIVETMNLGAEVVPVDRGGSYGNIRRPLYSVLGNTRARALGIRLRPWREALVDYLRVKYPR